MSVSTNSGMRRPPPPSSRPPPPPTAGEEGCADISSSDYRERLRSKSRARHSSGRKSSDAEPELKKKINDSIDTLSPFTPHDSRKSSLIKEVVEEKKPPRNKVKLLQPPDGLTLMDLDNDLLKRRFKHRAEKYYSPVVLLTDGLYTTSSAKYSLVEDKAPEIGLVVHINIPKENDPDKNLSPFERLDYDLNQKDLNVEQICDKIYKTSIKKTDSRKATLIRYDSKTSEDIVATISGTYLVKHCDSTVQETYSILKSKLLSSDRKEKMNTDVYLKLVEIYDSKREKIRLLGKKNVEFMQEVIKKNLVSLSLNWIPLFIILLVITVYFRGIFKMAYSFVF